MAKIARKLTDLVGNTPLMELSGYSGKYGLEQDIIAKLEAFNPAGSVKDRVALSMIEDAEVRGLLKPLHIIWRRSIWISKSLLFSTSADRI